MIVAVLDTNLLASAVVGVARPESTPGILYRAWVAEAFVLAVSAPILAELAQTFEKAYFRRAANDPEIAAALAAIRHHGKFVHVVATVHDIATHPEDDAVLATAISAGADYLVTGDRQLRLLETIDCVAVVSPREFLDVLELAPAED